MLPFTIKLELVFPAFIGVEFDMACEYINGVDWNKEDILIELTIDTLNMQLPWVIE